MTAKIRAHLLAAGVKNLQTFGYPAVTAENIMTDAVYRAFFKGMLEDNVGLSTAKVDSVITAMIAEIDAQEGAADATQAKHAQESDEK